MGWNRFFLLKSIFYSNGFDFIITWFVCFIFGGERMTSFVEYWHVLITMFVTLLIFIIIVVVYNKIKNKKQNNEVEEWIK